MASLLTAIGSSIANSVATDAAGSGLGGVAGSLMSSLGLGGGSSSGGNSSGSAPVATMPQAAPVETPSVMSGTGYQAPANTPQSLSQPSTMSGYASPFHALLGQLLGN